MTGIEDIISNFSIKKITKHLKNYFDLFLKPRKIYHNVLYKKKKSFNLVILHLHYLFFLLLIIFGEFQTVLTLLLLEVIITIIPFLIFLIPFLIFNKFYTLKIKWDRLFKLFIVIKLQIIPLLLLVILFTKWSRIESLYIIIDNLFWVIWVLFIVIPFVFTIKIWQKVFWVIINYMFINLAFFFLFLCVEYSEEFNQFSDRIRLNTPSYEYMEFNLNNNYSTYFMQDSLYCIVIDTKDTNRNYFERVQFVYPDFELAFRKSEVNYLRTAVNGTTEKDSLYVEDILTASNIDSFRTYFTNEVNHDITLSKKYADSTDFTSNKEFYMAMNKYLVKYNNSYKCCETAKKIIEHQNNIRLYFKITTNRIAIIYRIDTNIYEPEKSNYLMIKQELDDREEYSSFIMNIVLKPVDLLIDYAIDESMI